MRISDWSSDVCASDLPGAGGADRRALGRGEPADIDAADHQGEDDQHRPDADQRVETLGVAGAFAQASRAGLQAHVGGNGQHLAAGREHAGHPGGAEQPDYFLLGEEARKTTSMNCIDYCASRFTPTSLKKSKYNKA